MNIRNYIINNFKDDTKEDIRTSIDTSIKSMEEEPLIGLGVLFELNWNISSEEEKEIILDNIVKMLKEKNIDKIN